MIDRNCLINLDHQGVVHPDNANEVSETITEVNRIDLEIVIGFVEPDVDFQISLGQCTNDE